MVKDYDPVGGKYEFIPSYRTEKGRNYFLSQEAWSFDELCSLISGVDHNWEFDPVARVAWANGEDTIKKGIASVGLKPLTVMGELYFLPQETVLWASRTLKDFPFKPNDMNPDKPKEVVREFVGERKIDNLYRMIGVLALTLGCRQKDGQGRKVSEVLSQNVNKTKEQLIKIGIPLEGKGLATSTFYEAIEKGMALLRSK